jgi:hypothetical protein
MLTFDGAFGFLIKLRGFLTKFFIRTIRRAVDDMPRIDFDIVRLTPVPNFCRTKAALRLTRRLTTSGVKINIMR